MHVVTEGALVVINGPRFSSRAESLMHQQAGWSIVGMTTMPEAVAHEEVLRVMAANVERLKSVLHDAVGQLPAHEDDDSATCACRRSLDGIPLPFPLP
jgi:5'-methylthioadenosine phosphorylase